MKRFITYLYAYKNGQKIKNTGYIRVDVRAQRLDMQINIKDLELNRQEGTFYIIVKKEATIGIPLTEIQMKDGCYNSNSYFDLSIEENKNVQLEHIIGVGICFKNGYYIASCWKDGEEDVIAERAYSISAEISWEETENEEIINEKSVRNDEVVAVSLEQVEDYEDEVVPIYQKINLSEIYTLPSHYWHFSNNSFLLHGFWNYGYLVLKETVEENTKRTALGVPGIFEEPERVMATYFGFPEFEELPSQVEKMVMGEQYEKKSDEKNQAPQSGTFGAWFVNL